MNAAPALLRALAALVVCVLVLTACERKPAAGTVAADPAPPPPGAFTILAGSELKPLEAAIVEAGRAAGVGVHIDYAGTLDIVERIEAGEAYDAILPPNGAYPALALGARVQAREKLFYSRVAFGVKPAVLAALGWDRQTPTWADIAAAAGRGSLRYAMSNPTASNTGMSALFAVAAAAAGKTEDLQIAEIDGKVLRAFMQGQQLTAGSSGWLAEAWPREAGRLDAMVNYEAVLLRLNRTLPAEARLSVVYPRDGVITADYPLLLLNAGRRAGYDALVAALRATAFQNGPVAEAFLRPSNPDARPSPDLPATVVSELAFPNRLEVIDAVLAACQREWRRPATSIFVLDTSGSMKGRRLDAMRQALLVLAGAEPGRASSRYASFQARERVVLIDFSDQVARPQTVRFDSADPASARAAVHAYVETLRADGGTAVYDALAVAEAEGALEARREPQRIVSILLLTDGENNHGMSFADFERRYAGVAPVRVFPILFGEGSVSEMNAVAQLTGGRTFDARKVPLAQVFKEIRGYQ